MTKPRLILILGLGHSGTTILDAALGCSPDVVGLGEAARMLDPARAGTGNAWAALREGRADEVNCSCGASAAACPVWSPLIPKLAGGQVSTLYPQLTEAARAVHPQARYLLDSTPGGKKYLDDLSAFDLRIIQITRDPRSWAASRVARTGAAGWRSALVWRRNSAKLTRAIDQSGLPAMRIGYEEFALRPEPALRLICDWLGIAFTPLMLAPYANTQSHIIAGNIAVRDPGRAATISYDGTWMTPGRGRWLTALVAGAMARQARALVYSNDILRRKV